MFVPMITTRTRTIENQKIDMTGITGELLIEDRKGELEIIPLFFAPIVLTKYSESEVEFVARVRTLGTLQSLITQDGVITRAFYVK